MSKPLTPANILACLGTLGLGQVLHFTAIFCRGAAQALIETGEDVLAAEMRSLSRELEDLSARAQALQMTMDMFKIKLPQEEQS